VLKISGTLVVGSGKGIAAFEEVFAEHHVKVPRPDGINRLRNIVF
jgi:hypothetical protein